MNSRSFKITGIDWMPRLPATWQCIRLKRVVELVTDKTTGNNESRYIGLQNVESGTGRFLAGNAEQDAESSGIQFRRGDVLFGKLRPYLAKALAPDFNGRCTSEMLVLRPKQIARRFLHHYCLSHPFVQLVDSSTFGAKMPRADWEFIGRMAVPLPPEEEADAIAAFLDRETARLDGLVAQKEKLLALLEEKRASLIIHAVTRGLNPHAPTRPSGIPWLGNIPKHWEALPLRRRWQVYDCKHITAPFVDEGIPLASTTEVQSLDLDLSRAARTTPEFYERLIDGGRKPGRGDIIYCRNVTVGAAAFVNTDEQFAMGQDVCLIRSETENQRFLAYQMRSAAMQAQLGTILIGSTFQRINVAEIKTLVVTIPPRHEQDAICQFLDPQMEKLSAIEAKLKTAIGLLRERRTALISAAVTGQIDVRNWKAAA